MEAEHFLDELSKVYRYLLKNNEDSISTLEKEVAFIGFLLPLLKTRYGDALQMNIDIDNRYYGNYQMPSLSLQLLVENAVKAQHRIAPAAIGDRNFYNSRQQTGGKQQPAEKTTKPNIDGNWLEQYTIEI